MGASTGGVGFGAGLAGSTGVGFTGGAGSLAGLSVATAGVSGAVFSGTAGLIVVGVFGGSTFGATGLAGSTTGAGFGFGSSTGFGGSTGAGFTGVGFSDGGADSFGSFDVSGLSSCVVSSPVAWMERLLPVKNAKILSRNGNRFRSSSIASEKYQRANMVAVKGTSAYFTRNDFISFEEILTALPEQADTVKCTSLRCRRRNNKTHQILF